MWKNIGKNFLIFIEGSTVSYAVRMSTELAPSVRESAKQQPLGREKNSWE